MTPTINTNQDLYRAVTGELERQAEGSCTLEQYLLRLWRLLATRPTTQPLDVADFAQALGDAFQAAPLAIEHTGVRAIAADTSAPVWIRQLARQLVDLREMDRAGTLTNEFRYFGIDAPSGARWYNFEPRAFVECGLTGTFGGWTPQDNTGRQYVPGPVAVMAADGTITTANPEDLDDGIYPMETVSWEEFSDFLYCGQSYE